MLSIANANAVPPKVDPAYEAFVQTLVQSKIEFAFKDGTAFQAFLAEHLKDHKEAQRKFEEVRYQKLFSPIPDVVVTEDYGPVKWRLVLKVKTRHGDFDIELFTSIKRHALLSFMSNYSTPRNPKEKNSLVRDDLLMQKCLLEYGNRVACVPVRRTRGGGNQRPQEVRRAGDLPAVVLPYRAVHGGGRRLQQGREDQARAGAAELPGLCQGSAEDRGLRP